MFSIYTDSTANLTEGLIKQYNINVLYMTYEINGEEHSVSDLIDKTNCKIFYNVLRTKGSARTSLINADEFETAFKKELDIGNNVLYIGISSILSGTFNSARIAAETLNENYKNNRVIVIDSTISCMAQGILVCEAARLKEIGKSIFEVAEQIEKIKRKSNIIYTVDDMFHLKRGGRISGAAAIISTMLSIKPLMSTDSKGKLTVTGKVRGRKAAIQKLFETFKETADKNQAIVGINHADCEEDALILVKLITETGYAKNVIFDYIDPVLGVHGGPGTLTISYFGNERKD